MTQVDIAHDSDPTNLAADNFSAGAKTITKAFPDHREKESLGAAAALLVPIG